MEPLSVSSFPLPARMPAEPGPVTWMRPLWVILVLSSTQIPGALAPVVVIRPVLVMGPVLVTVPPWLTSIPAAAPPEVMMRPWLVILFSMLPTLGNVVVPLNPVRMPAAFSPSVRMLAPASLVMVLLLEKPQMPTASSPLVLMLPLLVMALSALA